MSQVIVINGSSAPSLINFRGDLIKDLVKKGYEVHATAPDMSPVIAEGLGRLGCRPHSVELKRNGLSAFSDIRYFRAMLRIIRETRADFVLNYTIKPNIWGSLAARVAGVPAFSMITGAGYIFAEEDGLKGRVVKYIAKRLYGLALARNDAVIFQNPDDVEDFAREGMIVRDNARLVRGSGVNLTHFHHVPLPEAPVFLMISRLLRSKGCGEYAAAARIVKSRNPEARFLLVGPIDSGPEGVAEEEVESWKACGIEYEGELTDVRPALARASIFVLPSYYREGTPRSILEAMAMGRPVITTDAPGCRETVENGRNGILVEPRNIDSLAEAMTAIGRDAAMRKRMGNASLERARDIFSVEKVNASLMEHLGL